MLKAIALAALLVCGCSSAVKQAGSSDIVATVGGHSVTLQDIDERWQKDEPAEHAETTQKLYEGRRKAIDAIIADFLLSEAAKGTGLSPEAFEEAELSRRMKPVTPADVEAFYRANVNEMGGRSFDTAAPLINRFLDQQHRAAARQDLIAELKTKDASVRVLLEAPRRTVKVENSDPARGNPSAPITVIEFSDFQCPFCLRANPTLKQLQQAYGDRLRVVWKDFPLTQIHPDAFKAAEAAHCAGEQGKFWEYHDTLFANQKALKPDDLQKYAADAKLDTERFSSCLTSSKYAGRVGDGVKLGNQLGVNSTPTLYINGRVIAGAYPFEDLKAIVDEELARLKK
jgi:protein-disulfide isomerase